VKGGAAAAAAAAASAAVLHRIGDNYGYEDEQSHLLRQTGSRFFDYVAAAAAAAIGVRCSRKGGCCNLSSARGAEISKSFHIATTTW
jgi:hypothetical protein